MSEQCVWTGSSGTDYTYYVYSISTGFKPAACNYILARQVGPKWKPVYIGQTSDISERFDSHHKALCIQRAGATHIHVHTSADDESERKEEEQDLIANYDPECNG